MSTETAPAGVGRFPLDGGGRRIAVAGECPRLSDATVARLRRQVDVGVMQALCLLARNLGPSIPGGTAMKHTGGEESPEDALVEQVMETIATERAVADEEIDDLVGRVVSHRYMDTK